MNNQQRNELLYQALETELGGVEVYTAAVDCAVNPDLKKEWQEYLNQTKHHVEVIGDVLDALGLDKSKETTGRQVVREIGKSLLKAMTMAQNHGQKEQAQIVAAECVVLAETKDHLNWELIGEMAKKEKGETAKLLKTAG